MHILDYLTNAEKQIRIDDDSVVHFQPRLDENSVRVEYRLICSGMLYPGQLLGDWAHSDVARILLSLPVELLVASRPYDDYPQEFALRFVVSPVEETGDRIIHSYRPDWEIASDFAALLTLLCRRLITVAGKVREQYSSRHVTPILADYPGPIATTLRSSYWKEHPLDFVSGRTSVYVHSYHPPNVPFGSADIMQTLLALPKLDVAPAIVRAARLYASAMEHIESQVETSYQLLISAVETIAGAALEGWQPDTEAKIASKSALVAYASKTENLDKELTQRLAVAACEGDRWVSRKFKKFLLDNVDREAISGKDELFIVPEEFCPKHDQIEKAIAEVYQARSGATHSGKSYPASAVIGPSTRVPMKAFDDVVNEKRPFPPIGWFERVVNNAICRFLRTQVEQIASMPGPSADETADE